MTPQFFEVITSLKGNRELWEDTQQLILCAIWWVKWKILVHVKEWKKTKLKKREWTETIINNKINIAYYIDLNYTNLKKLKWSYYWNIVDEHVLERINILA